MKYCSNCGQQLNENATFCTKCGSKTISNSNNNTEQNINNDMMCPKCHSNNINVQVVTSTKIKNKHHSIWYWIFIGWWLEILLWLFLTIPRLLVALFGHKKQKVIQKNYSIAVCQNCGNQWKI